MTPFYVIWVILLVFLSLIGGLYYFGIAVARTGFSLFSTYCSLPTCWDGKFQDASIFLRRNFVIFQKYNTLAIQVEAGSGTLSFEVIGPDGSILFPSSSTYEQDGAVLIDVGQFKRCSVTLRMEHFCGQFHIALQ